MDGADAETFAIFHPQEPEARELHIIDPLRKHIRIFVKISRELLKGTFNTADDIRLLVGPSQSGNGYQNNEHGDHENSDPLQNTHLPSCLILHTDNRFILIFYNITSSVAPNDKDQNMAVTLSSMASVVRSGLPTPPTPTVSLIVP